MPLDVVDHRVVKQPYKRTRFTSKQLQEFSRCAQDPIYFMEAFMKVRHSTRGEVPFILYDYQKEIVETYHGNKDVILLCGRQMGKTEVTVGYLLWYAMFIPNSTILIAGNVHRAALEIMKRIRFAYEHLPDHIRAGATSYQKGSLEFDNGSSILSQATTENTGRGLALSILYCLTPDNSITVRNKRTGEIRQLSLQELHQLNNR